MMRGAVAVLTLLFIITCFTTPITIVRCEPQVPCYFIFGDSLSDVGNNNDLVTKAKANYPPYGIDFPGGIPTGRFSNGRVFVDRITELLEFDNYIPPFSSAKGEKILKGVNYASGAAGIRYETGQHLGERISMYDQIMNHNETVAKIKEIGKTSTVPKLEECLYTVNIGSNDYINNYFKPGYYYISSSLYNPDEFAEELINQYAANLKILHSLGARKIAVFGLGLIGCSLGEIYTFGTNGSLCVDKINAAVQPFNQKLVNMVDDLTMELSDLQLTYIGSAASTDTGSAIADAPCCKVRDDFQCIEFEAACEGRNNYIFWDGFHTTEVVNVLTGEIAYSALDTKHIHPVDIKTLVSIDRESMINQVKNRMSSLVSSA